MPTTTPQRTTRRTDGQASGLGPPRPRTAGDQSRRISAVPQRHRPTATTSVQGPSRGRRPVDLRLRFLCVFAVLNPLVVQVGFFVAPSSAGNGLSAPQLFQGLVFIMGIGIVLLSRWRSTVHTTRLGGLMLLIALCGTVFLAKSALEGRGSASVDYLRNDRIFYFKMVFWSFMWWLVAIVVRNDRDARRLLRAVVLGAVLTSVIIIVCYVTGAGSISAYARVGVRASVGTSGVSVKQTVAFLGPCAFVAIYLRRRQGKWIGLAMALVVICATLLAYERAIQVGMVLAALWLLFWRVLLSGRRSNKNWAVSLLVVGLLGGLILFSRVGFESLKT